MWIQSTTQAFQTPFGRFEIGDVGEVNDALGLYMVLRGRAAKVPEPPDLQSRFQLRLQNGASKPCVFNPFVGEFGHQIMYHMRLVHFHRAKIKLVCCRRGLEVLYPSADAFDYDWVDPIEDQYRCGTDRTLREWPLIEKRYPGHSFIQAGNALFPETLVFEPGRAVPLKPKQRGLRADVCIGTRARKFDPIKNWQHWGKVAEPLTKMGLSVAVIGTRASSYPIAGAIMSGDFGDVDAAIELLQNCRLFIGGDSGCAHLAAAVRCNMLVIPVPKQCGRHYLPRMEAENPGKVSFFPDECWDDPDKAAALATQVAASTIAGNGVGIRGAWKVEKGQLCAIECDRPGVTDPGMVTPAVSRDPAAEPLDRGVTAA